MTAGSWRASVHRRGLRYPCDHCGAAPGEACRTAAGRAAATQHVNRTYKVVELTAAKLYRDRKALR